MDKAILELLQTIKDPFEKAALVADLALEGASEHLALLVHRSIILHWLDLNIARALLQDIPLTEDEIATTYRQFRSLTFIEQLPWGTAFQEVTRKGLLQQYARIQPELLKKAASIAAPFYAARATRDKLAAEALFCYMVAGERETASNLLESLLKRADYDRDWQYRDTLFSLYDEARGLPFVLPLPLSKEQIFLKNLVHSVCEIQKTQAVDTYESAQFKKAWIYISQGAQYATQGYLKQAQKNYGKALQIEPHCTLIYQAKGIIAMQQDDYFQAVQDFTEVLESNKDHLFVLEQQGLALNECDEAAQALAAYEHVLRLDPTIASVYREKGQALIKLERYEEALAAYNQSIDLENYDIEAYIGKSVALSRLLRYSEAQTTREIAEHLTAKIASPDQKAQQVHRILTRHPTRQRFHSVWSVLGNGLAVIAVLAIIGGSIILFTDHASRQIGTNLFVYNKIIQIVGQPEPNPVSIVQGSDGDLWFTDHANAIGKITPGGTIQEVFIPKTPDSSSPEPVGITNGPDGTIWFTLQGSSYVGRIKTTAPFVATSIHYFPLDSSEDRGAVAMTTGPDGNLWITTEGDNVQFSKVECMMPTTGHILRVVMLGKGEAPSAIISADGKLWVAEYDSLAIVSITTSGEVHSYSTSSFRPLNLVSGSHGDIWITEGNNSIGQIGHISATGVQEPPVSLGTMQPEGITAAIDGTIWFTAWPPATQGPSRVGMIESLSPGGVTASYAFPTHCLPTHNSREYDNGNGITIGAKGDIWVIEGGVFPPSITHS